MYRLIGVESNRTGTVAEETFLEILYPKLYAVQRPKKMTAAQNVMPIQPAMRARKRGYGVVVPFVHRFVDGGMEEQRIDAQEENKYKISPGSCNAWDTTWPLPTRTGISR